MSEDHVDRKIGDLTVRIDRKLCIGSGNCIKVAPRVFEMDEEGVVAFRNDARSDDREQLIESCEVCPVDALFVLDAEAKQIVPG
jgi:ferredoxin